MGPAFIRRVALLVVCALPLPLPLIGAVASRAAADPPGLGNESMTAIVGPTRTDLASTFGYNVALSDDGLTALVEDPFVDHGIAPGFLGYGVVSVYTRADGASPWTHTGDLPHPSQLGDIFGVELALSGDGQVALATFYDHANEHDVVEAYERTATGWDGPQVVYVGETDLRGVALDGDGTTAIVADPQRTPGATTGDGGVHVFRRSGATWAETQLLPLDSGPGAAAVSADGRTIVYEGDAPAVAHRASTSDDFDAATPLAGTANYKAFSIAADGRTIVGTDEGTSNGATVWAAANDGTWSVQATITGDADDVALGVGAALDASGSRLALSDVGYRPGGDPAQPPIGRVSIYERHGATWTKAGDVTSSNAHGLEYFGKSLDFAADGTTLLIGTLDQSATLTPSVYVWETDLPAPDAGPVAVDDSTTTTQTTPVDIDVLSNDSDAVPVVVTTPPTSAAGGTLHTNGGGHVTYAPPEPFAGSDHFTYTTCTTGAAVVCDTATVTVTVGAVAMFDAQVLSNGARSGVPYIGDFNGDHRDDIFWDTPRSNADSLWLGQLGGAFSARSIPKVDRSLRPIVGNFNGDRRADILWWSPTSAREVLWLGKATGFWFRSVASVTGAYRPFTGDFNGDGHDDVFWYAPGRTAEMLWYGGTNGFRAAPVGAVDATFEPLVADFNGNGHSDILWYAPGSTREMLWYGAVHGFGTAHVGSVNATFTPVVGDYNGDHRADVLWYAPGSAREVLWRGAALGFGATTVPRVDTTYTPRVGDFDGDGRDDIFWYAPGAGQEMLWHGGATRMASMVAPSQPGSSVTRVGDFDNDGRADVLFMTPGHPTIWSGRAF